MEPTQPSLLPIGDSYAAYEVKVNALDVACADLIGQVRLLLQWVGETRG